MPAVAPPVLPGPVAAQACRPSYGGCLPNVTYALDCADIGQAVVEVWDVYNVPFGLDTPYGPGDGWTGDSY